LFPDVVINISLAFAAICSGTLLVSRLNLSSIPFLIILGMLLGPHAPELGRISFKIISDNDSIELLSRLGVLMMLFYLGLEFSAGRIAAAGKTLAKSGTVYVGINFVRGLAIGWLFFNSWTEALVVAGITGISSSAIVTKLLVDLKRAANPETELILGIIVFEDVFIAVYLSIVSGLLITDAVSIRQVLANITIVLVFMVSIIVFSKRIGQFFEQRLKFNNSETFIITIFTLLLIVGVLAERLHIAEAIGALLLGLVLAETTHNQRIIQMIISMRDLFGAVFFSLSAWL